MWLSFSEAFCSQLLREWCGCGCSMNDVGLKVQLNGPFTFSPDGNPLVGPVEGTGLAMRHGSNARSNGPPAADGDGDVHNFWAACAVMAGFSQGTFEPSSRPVHRPVQACLTIH